jgi:DNA modification methylase
MVEEFLNGRVALHSGDCLAVLKTYPDCSVDSVCTDPPYHLTSIVKRFGAQNSAPAKVGQTGAYARASAGFMGKQWDGGDVAFRTELWAEVLRVLKPGGHLAAFGGTRTYHRMACAIEDAGFEVRDMIGWLYGSGFPKSHDVSKGIDRSKGAKRTVVGKEFIPNDMRNGGLLDVAHGDRPGYDRDMTVATTPEAQAWEGWGTALKPAQEPICLARKPLTGTVAQNVLEHGTGALNINGCRVDFASPADAGETKGKNAHGNFGSGPMTNEVYGKFTKDRDNYDPVGRWPANVIHDGSDEVVAAFPQTAPSTIGKPRGAAAGEGWGMTATGREYDDSGSAARFFYTAKADSDDRLGSKHPTVKPLDLMQWLVRLVTPPGGVVLDPFAGTGTTGEAAWREGFRAVLIEREIEYQDDIRRRMALCLSGPDERARESIKAKLKGQPLDHGPLFDPVNTGG